MQYCVVDLLGVLEVCSGLADGRKSVPPRHGLDLWSQVLPRCVPNGDGYFSWLCDGKVVVELGPYLCQAGDHVANGSSGWVMVDWAAKMYTCTLFVLLLVCTDCCLSLCQLLWVPG